MPFFLSILIWDSAEAANRIKMITKEEFMVELAKPLVSMKRQDIETVAQFYENIPDKQEFGVEVMCK